MNGSDPITRLNAALDGCYCIERETGEGGMATVYLADDLGLGRVLFPPSRHQCCGELNGVRASEH